MAKSTKKEQDAANLQAKISGKSSLKESDKYSNPCLSAEKSSISKEFEAFFESYQSLWQYTVADTLPYKKARLVHHNYDLSKRWYVLFYAWDVSLERLARKRLFEPMNRKHTVRERMEIGRYMVQVVNNDLAAGKVLGKDKITTEIHVNVMKLKVTQAIDWVIEQKKAGKHRDSYLIGFASLNSHLKGWLEYSELPDFPIRDLKQSDLFEFFRYLNQVKQLGNKTYNNYKNYLVTAINFLLKREPRLFKVNPAVVVDTLPTIAKKHAAFSDKKMLAIKDKCMALGYDQLLLFIQCIYYTLARPNELIHLRVNHIDLDEQRIFIPGEISKTKFDEYVGITDGFKAILQQSGILSLPGHYYVFGNNFCPGETPWADYQPFWRRNQLVLKDLGYYQENPNYSLYSYKHSGAISLYKATRDIIIVQHQCRHKTVNQTQEYLRDLGLIVGWEGINNWKGAI